MPSRTLRVMISSRCIDQFPSSSGRMLSDIRRDLKRSIEEEQGFQVLGTNAFDVWINEEEPPNGGDWNSAEVCLSAVESSDILISISNGNAGWAVDQGDMGICHAELQRGLEMAPSKVRLIELDGEWCSTGDQVHRDESFQAFLKERNLFRGSKPQTEEQLCSIVKETLRSALIQLAHSGVREAHRGGGPSGQSMDWNRLTFLQRKRTMEESLQRAILRRSNAELVDNHVVIDMSGTAVVLALHAIPEAYSESAARELVGQPFLHDHLMASFLSEERGGPIHIITCLKNVTVTQARKFLGFPDATVIAAPFGVYVADNIQKVQFAFIVGCTDDQNTQFGVQKFFEWLVRTGELSFLANRAVSRAKIVSAIASQVEA